MYNHGFRQEKIDGRHLKSGDESFDNMPNLYIITITNYDPFGHDYMMYRIRNCCQEIPELIYDDGLEFLYFYTGGHRGGNDNIKAMLNYFQNSTRENVTDRTTEDISEIVEQVRNLPKVRNEYMTLGDIIDMEREEATKNSIIACILICLQKYGDIPAGLKEKLEESNNIDQLHQWYKIALDADSVENFMKRIEPELLS